MPSRPMMLLTALSVFIAAALPLYAFQYHSTCSIAEVVPSPLF